MPLLLAVILARGQFGFTIAFHILLPAFSIGSASFLAVLEILWLVAGRGVYMAAFRYWLKTFAVAFAMDVVSGIVMAYEIGANWSGYSAKVGPILRLMSFARFAAAVVEAYPWAGLVSVEGSSSVPVKSRGSYNFELYINVLEKALCRVTRSPPNAATVRWAGSASMLVRSGSRQAVSRCASFAPRC